MFVFPSPQFLSFLSDEGGTVPFHSNGIGTSVSAGAASCYWNVNINYAENIFKMLLNLQMRQTEGWTVQLWNVSGMKKNLLNAFEKRDCVKMSIFLLNKRDVFCLNFLCFYSTSGRHRWLCPQKKISKKESLFVTLPSIENFWNTCNFNALSSIVFWASYFFQSKLKLGGFAQSPPTWKL